VNSGKCKTLTRREFLRAVGITTAGITMSSIPGATAYAAARSHVVDTNGRLGVGFVGVGEQGMRHVRSVLGLPQSMNVRPVAVCDVWSRRARTAAHEARIAYDKIYADYRRLLEDRDVDVVLVAAPDHWHAKIATDVLESGRGCYVEAPFTRYLDEALKLLETVRRTNCALQIGSIYDSLSPALADLLCDPDANENTVDWKAWLGPCRQRSWDPERFFNWRRYSDYSARALLGSGLSVDEDASENVLAEKWSAFLEAVRTGRGLSKGVESEAKRHLTQSLSEICWRKGNAVDYDMADVTVA
jgi:hypothetical protein